MRLYSILLILALTQGCQLLNSSRLNSAEQEQIDKIFFQASQYSSISDKEQLSSCEKLKNEYSKTEHWPAAWLMLYSLNKDFKCINLSDSIKLSKVLQNNENFAEQLKFLNQHQIHLFNQMQELQHTNFQYKKNNHALKSKLKHVDGKLKDLSSKIQALKIIETTLNKKLSDDSSEK